MVGREVEEGSTVASHPGQIDAHTKEAREQSEKGAQSLCARDSGVSSPW